MEVYLVAITFILLYIYVKSYVFGYWKRHGVPHEKATIPLGNFQWQYFFGKISFGSIIKENYEKFKHHRFHGFYMLHKPVMIINDPKLIHSILVEEFPKFSERGWFYDEKSDPMTQNLFLQPEKQWKRSRSKLTPMFTPSKIRQMYPQMLEISDNLIDTCNAALQKSDTIDVKDMIVRYTTDVTSSIIYGFNCDSLRHPDCDFRQLGMQAFKFGRINILLASLFPEVLTKMSSLVFDGEINNFFHKVFCEVLEHRRREKIVRNDFVNLMIQLIEGGRIKADEKSTPPDRDEGEGVDCMSLTEAAAQSFNFLLAGFEASSSQISYCLLELAMNPEIQERLREEIDEVAASPSGFSFDSIMNMEYLDMVISETMRKHTPMSFINRICTREYQIPDSNYTIPKEMHVLICPPGIQRNEDVFPNPDRFDPTRFDKNSPNFKNICVDLGFGEGPRNCIGKRFGHLQTKQAVAIMLYNYKLYISDLTNLPIEYVIDTLQQTPKGSVNLRLERRR